MRGLLIAAGLLIAVLLVTMLLVKPFATSTTTITITITERATITSMKILPTTVTERITNTVTRTIEKPTTVTIASIKPYTHYATITRTTTTTKLLEKTITTTVTSTTMVTKNSTILVLNCLEEAMKMYGNISEASRYCYIAMNRNATFLSTLAQWLLNNAKHSVHGIVVGLDLRTGATPIVEALRALYSQGIDVNITYVVAPYDYRNSTLDKTFKRLSFVVTCHSPCNVHDRIEFRTSCLVIDSRYVLCWNYEGIAWVIEDPELAKLIELYREMIMELPFCKTS